MVIWLSLEPQHQPLDPAVSLFLDLSAGTLYRYLIKIHLFVTWTIPSSTKDIYVDCSVRPAQTVKYTRYKFTDWTELNRSRRHHFTDSGIIAQLQGAVEGSSPPGLAIVSYTLCEMVQKFTAASRFRFRCTASGNAYHAFASRSPSALDDWSQ